jgi:lambda repressor-like predicted transcriptional regulator
MIDHETRKAVVILHGRGVTIRAISRQLGIDRNTIRSILERKGAMPDRPRSDKIEIDPQLLRKLHTDCNGWKERIHEKLTEQGKQIGYSTLTRLIRELDLDKKRSTRCGRVADEPGAEIQHDTSPYQIKIGGTYTRITASLIYFRYCKLRYLKFYRSFTRFRMKCFFHESLTFFGYVAAKCIIDNTNLAVLRGTGKNAVMVPEMERFARQFSGLVFEAHEIKHSNRKAGNERGFWTVETNFFPGREFSSLEDLNRQAFEWSTVRCANRPVGKSKLVPAQAFELEKLYLKKLPPHITPPYLVHERGTDQYGYAAFAGNYYWVPGTTRFDVKILEYADRIKIFHNRKELIDYALPAEGTKNEVIKPPELGNDLCKPNNLKKRTGKELADLKALSESVTSYLDFALKSKGVSRHRFIRNLYSLYKRMSLSLFVKTIERAIEFEITDIRTIERMAHLLMHEGCGAVLSAKIDENFLNRQSYLDGQMTDDPDLSFYDNYLKGGEDEEGD